MQDGMSRNTRTAAGPSAQPGNTFQKDAAAPTSQRIKESITKQWRQTVRHWYPELHSKTYFLPPLHFNRVPYDVQTLAEQPVLVPQTPPDRPTKTRSEFPGNSGGHSQSRQGPIPSQIWHESLVAPGAVPKVYENEAREDRTLKQFLSDLRQLAEQQDEAMMVLTRLDFRKYLNNPTKARGNTTQIFPTIYNLPGNTPNDPQDATQMPPAVVNFPGKTFGNFASNATVDIYPYAHRNIHKNATQLFSAPNNAAQIFHTRSYDTQMFPTLTNATPMFYTPKNATQMFPTQNNATQMFPTQNNATQMYLPPYNAAQMFPALNNASKIYPPPNNATHMFLPHYNTTQMFPPPYKATHMFPRSCKPPGTSPKRAGSAVERGDFDLLIIHRRFGLLIGELKSVNADPSRVHDLDKAVLQRVQKAVEQLRKGERVLRHLVSDLRQIPITKTLVFHSITSAQLERALVSNPQLTQDLQDCLKTHSLTTAISRCLCQDSVMSEWWQQIFGSKGRVDPALYETLVARFCGPATTVDVPTVTTPSPLRTESDAIALTGVQMSLLRLYPHQQDLLNKHLPRVVLWGPPGTGKTVMLVMKGLHWKQQGKVVHVLSSHSDSRAATFLIEHQLLVARNSSSSSTHDGPTPTPTEGLCVRRHMYDFGNNARDLAAAVDELSSAAKDGELFVLVDEVYTGSGVFVEFCTKLVARVPDLYLWAATVERADVGQSGFLLEEILTIPLRCPPSVAREVEKSGFINGEHVPLYTSPPTPIPTEGPGVQWLRHRGQTGHSQDALPEDCEQCGIDVVDLVVDLLERTHDSGIRVGRQQVSTPSNLLRLRYCDIFLLFVRPHDNLPVVRHLRKRGIPVQVVSSRGEFNVTLDKQFPESSAIDDDIYDVALSLNEVVKVTSDKEQITLLSPPDDFTHDVVLNASLLTVTPEKEEHFTQDKHLEKIRRTDDAIRDVALAVTDAVTVTEYSVVAGLERRVVISMGSQVFDRLCCMSRSTAFLAWVGDALGHEDTDEDY